MAGRAGASGGDFRGKMRAGGCDGGPDGGASTFMQGDGEGGEC